MGISLTFDDEDLKGGDFSPIPKGTYRASILDVEERESQSSDYPYYNVTLEISEGDFAGRKVWAICSKHPKAAGMLAQTLLRMGVTDDELQGGGEYDPEEEWPGQDVDVNVTIGTNQYDEPRNEVKWFGLPKSQGEREDASTRGDGKKKRTTKKKKKKTAKKGSTRRRRFAF